MRAKNKGITLVALIITIIVMLLLVGVSITTAMQNGLFENAGNSAKKWGAAQEQEKNLGNQIEIGGTKYDSIDDFLSGNSNIKLSYTIEGGKIKLTSKCESYEEFSARRLAGKTKEQKEQIFFESWNYAAKMDGKQTYGSIEEMLTDINKTANPKVESMEDFAIQVLEVESLDEALNMELMDGCGFGWTYLEERFNFVFSPMLASISGEEKVEMQEISENEYYMEYPVAFAGTYLFRVEKGTDYSSVAINVETGIAKVEPEDISEWKYTVNDDGTVTINAYKGSDTEVVFPNCIDGRLVTAIAGRKRSLPRNGLGQEYTY